MTAALDDFDPVIQAAVRDRHRRHWMHHDPQSIAAIFEALADWQIPPKEELRCLSHPTVVRAWAGDDLHPISLAQWIASSIPGAQLVEVDRTLYHDLDKDASSLAECISLLDQISEARRDTGDHESPVRI
jgi:hypothetical protein